MKIWFMNILFHDDPDLKDFNNLEHIFPLQLVKTQGGKQQFYPIPPKTVMPNIPADRWQNMKLSDRTANALRNVERDHWQTHYDRQHTGIGPTNPMKLDNLTEKTAFKDATGFEDDNLVNIIYLYMYIYSRFCYV